MDFLIKHGSELTLEVFQEILALDKKTYGDQVITDEGLAVKRYEKFKDGIIAAFYENELAGFTCFYSVCEDVYDRAVNLKTVFDDNLQVSDLKMLARNEQNYILLLDLNINEKFRNCGLGRGLDKETGRYLIQKEKEGCMIKKIFAYAYTEKGFTILKGLGGKPVWEKAGIFLMDLDPVIFMELSQ